MSALDVTPLAAANCFIGVSADVIRTDLAERARDDDERERLWALHVLPKFTKEFLESVIRSPARAVSFELDTLKSEIEEPMRHFIMYQNFANLAQSPVVSLKLVPWQFRVVMAPKLRQLMNDSSVDLDRKLTQKVFRNAGWHWWPTDTGFCFSPLNVYEELSAVSVLFTAWTSVRDAPIDPADLQAAEIHPPPIA